MAAPKTRQDDLADARRVELDSERLEYAKRCDELIADLAVRADLLRGPAGRLLAPEVLADLFARIDALRATINRPDSPKKRPAEAIGRHLRLTFLRALDLASYAEARNLVVLPVDADEAMDPERALGPVSLVRLVLARSGYQPETSRLSAEDVETALAAWRMAVGRPRKGHGHQPKWTVLVEILDRLGAYKHEDDTGQGQRAESLQKDWQRSRRETVSR